MDGIIVVFIVISVIISIINGVTKQAKKTANSTQFRPYFPPLSVDAPVPDLPQNEDYCEGSRIILAEGVSQEGLTSMEEADYTLTEINTSEDTSIEKRNPDIDLKTFQAEANNNSIETQVIREEPGLAGRLKLFETQDEYMKAVIYSEILKPRFKH